MSKDKLTPELLDKLKACKTAEDLAELAKNEGIGLDDDMLEALSGGVGGCLVDFLDAKGCLIL